MTKNGKSDTEFSVIVSFLTGNINEFRQLFDRKHK